MLLSDKLERQLYQAVRAKQTTSGVGFGLITALALCGQRLAA